MGGGGGAHGWGGRLLGRLAKLPLLTVSVALALLGGLVWAESNGPPSVFDWLPSGLLPARQALDLGGATRALLLAVGVAGSVGPVRKLLTHLETLAHELGHAAAAVLVGGTPTGLTLRLDGSGEARWLKRGRLHAPRLLVVALAGYAAPSIVALALVESVRRGFGGQTLGLVALCGAAAALLLARCAWSMIVAAGAAAATLALWHTTGEVPLPGVAALPALGMLGPQSGAPLAGVWAGGGDVAALTVAVILAGGAVSSAATQVRLRRLEGSDAHTISSVLLLPARAVAWVQLLGCVAAAAWVAMQLLS